MYQAQQTFTAPFEFYRIDIELKSKSCQKPSLALIELYNSNNFAEKPFNDQFYIEVKTPIARTTVLVPPNLDSVWVGIVFKKQPPGSYCWLLRNLYDSDASSLFFVRRHVPKQYAGGYSYFNIWRDVTSDYSSLIYGLPSVAERHLLSKGSVENMYGYSVTVDAPDTNPIIVEGKGTIAQVSDFVRDASGRAVGVIVSGSEIFEQGEVATKTVTFQAFTPQKYPVYNAKIMQDGAELGRTDINGQLITKVALGSHTYKGEKSLLKTIENRTAAEIAALKDINLEK
jgi:hypothetical protein